jgi:hypothetical protein
MKDLKFWLVFGFSLIILLICLSYFVYQLILSLLNITIIIY